MSGRLTIVRPGLPLPAAQPDEIVVSFDEFRRWVRGGAVLRHVARHGEGRLLVHRLETAGRPLPLGLALRAMARGRVWIEDTRGRRRAIDAGLLARWVRQIAIEPFRVSSLLGGVERAVDALERQPRTQAAAIDLHASPLYLRTDLSFGVRAGGSVGHTAGVVNELDAFAGPPIFLTTDDIATLKPAVETHLVAPSERFWNFKELPTFLLNETFEAEAARVLGGRRVAFVYHRYSLNNYAGLAIARRLGVPFVLEYNGSEIWIARHWSRRLKHEPLSRRIERLNLTSADLVVVVSRASKEEVVGQGAGADRVLVNPNGVDPDRYAPHVDGSEIRCRYGLAGKTVVGFIGTFGPWHGAEVLAQAFARAVAADGALRRQARLLMIGDGARLPATRAFAARAGIADLCAFTGLVPQEEGPRYLAACDVLVSPQVRNPDGTPFFGSPTKVFEYMAMARGILASDLDQIGEVLEHDRTAWLVAPGDVAALADGLTRLIADGPLRERLGAEARRRVLERYTWHQHTKRTIDRLRNGS